MATAFPWNTLTGVGSIDIPYAIEMNYSLRAPGSIVTKTARGKTVKLPEHWEITTRGGGVHEISAASRAGHGEHDAFDARMFASSIDLWLSCRDLVNLQFREETSSAGAGETRKTCLRCGATSVHGEKHLPWCEVGRAVNRIVTAIGVPWTPADA
jgi:hypothetical protein